MIQGEVMDLQAEYEETTGKKAWVRDTWGQRFQKEYVHWLEMKIDVQRIMLIRALQIDGDSGECECGLNFKGVIQKDTNG